MWAESINAMAAIPLRMINYYLGDQWSGNWVFWLVFWWWNAAFPSRMHCRKQQLAKWSGFGLATDVLGVFIEAWTPLLMFLASCRNVAPGPGWIGWIGWDMIHRWDVCRWHQGLSWQSGMGLMDQTWMHGLQFLFCSCLTCVSASHVLSVTCAAHTQI